MTLEYFLLESDDNPGTGTEQDRRDLPRAGIIKALIFDITAQTNGTSAGTRTDLTAQVDQIQIGAVESNSVSQIDGEDLDGFNTLMGNHALIDTNASDNHRNVFGFTLPLDPFMIGPNMDFNQPYGLPGSVARRVVFDYAADVVTDAGLAIDDKRMAIGAIVRKDGASVGYMTFHRHSFAGATGGVNTFTDVPTSGPNSKLLGVFNFEATNAGEVTGDGDHRTTQSIRDQAITVDRKVRLGPIYTTMMAAIHGQYETGAINDEGYSLWNLGMRNQTGQLGVPIVGGIPNNMEIRSSTGAAVTNRVHAIILNTNI